MATLADGVYRITAKLDAAACVDVESASQTSGANVQLYRDNDTNAQKWLVTTNADGTRSLRCLASGKLMDVADGRAVSGNNVWQWEANDTRAQKWDILDKGVSGGVQYWAVRSALNASLMLDHAAAMTSNRTNVQVFTDNGTDAQRWAFVPDTYLDAKLPVPSAVGMSYTASGEKYNGIAIVGTASAYPAWIGGAGGFQLRCRERGRYTGTDSWSGWGAWRSPSGSTANHGWGDGRSQTGSDNGASTTRRYTPGLSFTVDQGTYDRKEVQIEVRRFQANGNATYGATHGNGATGTIQFYFRPDMTWGTPSFAPDGIRLPYASSLRRNQNSITLDIKVGSRALVESYQATGMPYDGTVLIPVSELAFIPDDGAVLSITCAHKRDYTRTTAFTKTLSYSTGHGSALSASFASAPGYAQTVSLGNHRMSAAYLAVERAGAQAFVPCEEVSAGRFRIVPPLGTPYRVFCVTQDSDDVWATAMLMRPAVEAPKADIWNYGDGDWTVLLLDAEQNRSFDRDHEAYLASGNRFEAVYFGTASKSSIVVSGSIVPEAGIERSGFDDFERLKACGWATYRNALGEWYRVAVVSVSDDRSSTRYRGVTVTMREVV